MCDLKALDWVLIKLGQNENVEEDFTGFVNACRSVSWSWQDSGLFQADTKTTEYTDK